MNEIYVNGAMQGKELKTIVSLGNFCQRAFKVLGVILIAVCVDVHYSCLINIS